MRSIQLALLLGFASLLCAQSRQSGKPAAASAASRLISIGETGSKRYTQEEVIAATGLQIGQTASDDDFQLVSRHLGETGAFGNIAYTYRSSPQGMKVEFQLTDNEQFVPARFENFVWLSPQELIEKLGALVPLFQGQLPVTGSLADQVSDGLQTLAIERHMTGRVDYIRAGPQDGPVEAFVFSLTGQTILIREIEFPGAASDELPALQAAAKRLSGRDYQRTALQVEAEKEFLPVYLQRGYLKAALGEAQPKVVEETPEQTVVDVAFPVTPGRQYQVGDLQLSGCKVFPAEKLRELIHLQVGKPANAVQASEDVAAIKRLYGTRGYMAAQVRLTPEMDDAESTVKYVFQISEGDVYKMGDLDIRGLDSKVTERMAAAWKLREGDTYDSGYKTRYVESASSLLGRDQWNVEVHESVEDKDRVVDISLHFDLRR